jgi:hypothetical protein
MVNMKHTVKFLFGICITLTLLGAILWIFTHGYNETIVYVDRPVILDNLSEKINELKGQLISDLRKCESNGYKEEDGLVVFDSNRVASIGLYQFQVKTVQHYYKKLYGKEIGGKDAILVALDEAQASQLASDIIFKEGKLSDWVNCTRKVGLEQQLNVIKTISK